MTPKFKAITTDGKWVEGFFNQFTHQLKKYSIIYTENDGQHEVISETVCQFIDTYQGKDFWQNDTIVHPELGNGVIKWVNTGYVVEYSDGYTIDLHEDWDELEITGNIHDHLLVQKTENDKKPL